MEDKDSIFYTYQKLIQLRHEHDVITYGEVEPLHMEHPELFVYKRHLNNETWLVVANYSDQIVDIPEDIDLEGEIMIANNDLNGNALQPFDAFVVKVSGD
ncbi:DUF3459 domain-containing protein [Mammaliicoccus sciuri]|nr:DUF3459 domain-containing protein [Mammaliicoccus sciuri]